MAEATAKWYDEFYAKGFREASPWYATALNWLESHGMQGRLLELGCGRGKLLVELLRRKIASEEQLYGIDQSGEAIAAASEVLPHLSIGNIEERLPFENASFEVVVMMEVVEHLVRPWQVLREARRILAPHGTLLLSFPNYLNFPWLFVRVLAELLDRPSWIVLQPIDHMHIMPVFERKLTQCGFRVTGVYGSVFFPPILHRWEPPGFSGLMNAMNLGRLAFHPVLACEVA